MIKNIVNLITMLVLLSLMSACGNQLSKAQSGAGMGAAGGALIGQAIGHHTASTLIGATVGTMVGYIVGNEMDKYDNQRLTQVYEQGIAGTPTTWQNPDSGHMFQVTPHPAIRRDSGVCRTAEISSIIDGRRETALAKACRDNYGRWVL